MLYKEQLKEFIYKGVLYIMGSEIMGKEDIGMIVYKRVI